MTKDLTAADQANLTAIEDATGASEGEVLGLAETFSELKGDTVSEELAEGAREMTGEAAA